MAFTKITASGIGSTETVTLDGLSVINDGSFGGNVSVAGTLTYEDVTNIDSVGLITARAGVVVGSGITLSKDGDGFFTGIVTATSFSGSGALLTGVASTENIRTNTNAAFLANVSVVGTSTVTGNILPSSDSATDIGTNSVRFQNAYVDTYYGDGSNLTGITGTTINNNADNRLITGSGTANTLEGESNLTFGSDVLQVSSTTQGLGAKFINTANEYTNIQFSAARTTADNALGILNAKWNNNHEVAAIYLTAGDDTTNKDDGKIKFYTSAASGSLANRMEILNDGNVKVTDGDLVIGTSGHGIDFSATADGSGNNQAELLDDYEEGDWTPTINVGSFSVFNTCRYVKIGRFVKVNGGLIFNNTSDSAEVQISGLPFAGNGDQFIGSVWLRRTSTGDKKYISTIGQSGNSTISYQHDSNGNDMGGAIAYSNFQNSSTYNNFSISYFTNS